MRERILTQHVVPLHTNFSAIMRHIGNYESTMSTYYYELLEDLLIEMSKKINTLQVEYEMDTD